MFWYFSIDDYEYILFYLFFYICDMYFFIYVLLIIQDSQNNMDLFGQIKIASYWFFYLIFKIKIQKA